MLVVAEGETIFEDDVTRSKRRAELKGLQPSTEHKVSVVAVFTDEMQTLNSVAFVHKGK